MTRPLRILLVANDGLSAGHVARMIAIAGALSHKEKTQVVLATTSQAHSLLANSSAVVVQLPAPVVARSAGFSDTERRRLVSGTIEGLARSFAPDLVAIDTFPLGPHRELAGIDLGYAKRALVRRHIAEAASDNSVLTDGAELLDLVVLADDGGRVEGPTGLGPMKHVHVPPITIAWPAKSRVEARRELGLPLDGRIFLVAAGGGGDERATTHATQLAEALVRIDAECTVALALGPLGQASQPEAVATDAAPMQKLALSRSTHWRGSRVVPIHATPLAPLLAAFDGAFAPAGYNTTHELALARVPAVLLASPRPFDDQLARAMRFDATILDSFDDAAIAKARSAMKPLRAIEPGGARSAAKALIELATRRG